MAHNSYRKFSKNSKKKSSPYAEFNPHTVESPVMRNKNIIITSIDPGIVNCGIYTAAYDTETLKIKSIYLEKLVFNREGNHYLDSLKQLLELEDNHKIFSSSHYIIIESQMTVNYDLVRMGQHLISFFLTKLKNQGNRPLVIEISNQAKTQLIDEKKPKGLTKYQYKKWCTEQAIVFLNEKGGEEEKDYIHKLETSKKKDDMGDSVCQFMAWIKIMEGEYSRPTLPIKRY